MTGSAMRKTSGARVTVAVNVTVAVFVPGVDEAVGVAVA